MGHDTGCPLPSRAIGVHGSYLADLIDLFKPKEISLVFQALAQKQGAFFPGYGVTMVTSSLTDFQPRFPALV